MIDLLFRSVLLCAFVYWALYFLNNNKNKKSKKTKSTVVITEDNSVKTIEANEDEEYLDKMRTKRKNIRAEILSTEETYVNNLHILNDYFAKPIKDKKLIANDKTYHTIFPKELGIITNVNSIFLQKLKETIDTKKKSFAKMPNSESSQLADLLLSHAHSFKLYSTYITNYSSSISALRNEVKENSKLKDYLTEQKKILTEKGERVTTVQDLLINPIQRLPRYKLLFEDLLAKTEPSHKGYNKLKEAVKLISEIATFCNEKEREFQNQLALIELKKNHKIPLNEFIIPSRRLLDKMTDDVEYFDGKKWEPCQLYILSDVVICSFLQKKILQKKKETVLVQFTKLHVTTELGYTQGVKIAPGKQADRPNITIETTYSPSENHKKSTTETMTISFKSEKIRDQAMKALS